MQFGETTRAIWLQADMVINGAAELLLAAQVPFRRLHRDVAQEKLNLLKLPAGGVAKTRTGAATIMGR